MTAEMFFRLVAQMREQQRAYFRTRSSKALADSRRLEKDVDAEIERVTKILTDKQNPKLWQ